jgi:hypothetical protein
MISRKGDKQTTTRQLDLGLPAVAVSHYAEIASPSESDEWQGRPIMARSAHDMPSSG